MSSVTVCAPALAGWSPQVIYFLSWAPTIMFGYNFCWIVYLLGYGKKPKGPDFFGVMFLVYEGTLWLLYAICFLLLYLIRWFRPFGASWQTVCIQGDSQYAILWTTLNIYSVPDPLSVPLFVCVAYLIYLDWEQSGRESFAWTLTIFNTLFFTAYYVIEVLLQRMHFIQVAANALSIVIIFVIVGAALKVMIRDSPKDIVGIPRGQFVAQLEAAQRAGHGPWIPPPRHPRRGRAPRARKGGHRAPRLQSAPVPLPDPEPEGST